MPKKRNTETTSNKGKEGNKYDKIFKENLESLIPALIRSVLKLGKIRLKNLPQVKLQTTIEREPDFLKIMYSDEYPDGCILQIEFEGKDEKETDYRMLEYGAILVRKLKLPIDQHLIFLPEKKPQQVSGSVKYKNIFCRYRVHCIGEISYQQFITAEAPEEVLLSMLASHDNEPPETVIRLIIERLIQLKGSSLATQKFIKQLEILSGLRKLQIQTAKAIDNMVLEYDITKDVRFQQGQAIGIEKGKIKQAISSILVMAAKKFEIPMIAEVSEMTPGFVSAILKDYQKKDEIIQLLKRKQANVEKIAAKLKVPPILVEVIYEDISN